jgi:4-carboxymuconolactone decarboxylase
MNVRDTTDGARFVTQSKAEAGMAVRRQVLGDEHVNRSLANAAAFGQSLQELVVEYCWGEIWTRPGLDRRTRSLLNIGILTALRQRDELQLHVRGALNNGCTPEEIEEVLLQTAVYCGVPAALDASRAVREVLSDAAE